MQISKDCSIYELNSKYVITLVFIVAYCQLFQSIVIAKVSIIGFLHDHSYFKQFELFQELRVETNLVDQVSIIGQPYLKQVDELLPSIETFLNFDLSYLSGNQNIDGYRK